MQTANFNQKHGTNVKPFMLLAYYVPVSISRLYELYTQKEK